MAKRRKKRSRLPGAVLLLLLVAALGVFLYNYVFVVREVVVTGADSYAREDIIRLAQIPIGKPLRTVDEVKIRRAVESSGQLAFDSLSTEYPSTVRLQVHERKLAALVQNAGTLLGLDEDGCVIAQYSELPEASAIFITGLNVQHFAPGAPLSADAATIEAMRAVIQALRTIGAEALVSELNVADTRQLYLYSRTGIQVALGDSTGMERKLQWMKSALMDLESRGETRGRLDVSSGSKADFKPQ